MDKTKDGQGVSGADGGRAPTPLASLGTPRGHRQQAAAIRQVTAARSGPSVAVNVPVHRQPTAAS
jgi:hypothetical protein